MCTPALFHLSRGKSTSRLALLTLDPWWIQTGSNLSFSAAHSRRAIAREVIWGSIVFWRKEMAEFLVSPSRTGHSRRQEKGKGSHLTMLAPEARVNGLEDQGPKKRPMVNNVLDQKRSSYSHLAWSPSTHLLPANLRWMAQTVTSAIGRPSAAGLCGQIC